jgi:hypothetical protein
MTTQSQRDALFLLVLTMHDKGFGCWVSHGPRESKFGGSGVGDTIPRRASIDKAHATTSKQGTRSEAEQKRDKNTYHADDVLDNAYKNAARRVETFGLKHLLEHVLVRLL